MFRTVGDQGSLWEAVLPPELLKLPAELSRVDELLDDEVFFAPFMPFFNPTHGRPSTPMEVYLRLMFGKFRHGLGYESLCREVVDSITWRRFCRIPLDGAVPHPTTLMKLTTRCGTAAIDGLNEALLAKAVEAKVLRTSRLRADTTVIPANVAYPTDSGLLARAVKRIAVTGQRIHAAGGAVRTPLRDRSRAAGKQAHGIAAKLGDALRSASRRGAGDGPADHRRVGRPGHQGRGRCGEVAGQRSSLAAHCNGESEHTQGCWSVGRGGGAAAGPPAPSGQRPHRTARRDQADRGADQAPSRRAGP